MLIMPLSWEHYKISTERSIDAWIINPLSLPKNRAIFILHVFRWLKVNQLHAQSPRLYSELRLNVQGLTDRWRFVISLSLCSRAVIPMDPQWISHFHPAGQAALCLPNNGEPLYLQSGLLGQWQLLLHRLQSVYFQERFLQLHPPGTSDWTLVSHFHSLLQKIITAMTKVW